MIGHERTCTCTCSVDRCGCPIWFGPVCVCVRLRVHVHVRVRVRSARSSLMARSAFAGAFSIAAPALHPLRASLETRPRRPSIAYAGMHVSDRQLRKADSASACKRTRARTGSTRRSGPRLVWVCLRVRASDCACVCSCARACARERLRRRRGRLQMCEVVWSCLELSGVVDSAVLAKRWFRFSASESEAESEVNLKSESESELGSASLLDLELWLWLWIRNTRSRSRSQKQSRS